MAQLVDIDGKLVNLDQIDTIDFENGRTRFWFVSGAKHEVEGDYRSAVLDLTGGSLLRADRVV